MPPKIHYRTMSHLPRLLDMLYRPSELAEELSLPVQSVYRMYLAEDGCPHQMDQSGAKWINGRVFAEWARKVYAEQKSGGRPVRLPGQAYCFQCRQFVTVANPKRVANRVGGERLQGTCALCGRKVSIAIKAGHKLKDQTSRKSAGKTRKAD